jgi:hypothetical protein
MLQAERKILFYDKAGGKITTSYTELKIVRNNH